MDRPRKPQDAPRKLQDAPRKPDPRRHDQTYKGVFGHDEAARSLIRDFLAHEWHHTLDLAALDFVRTELIPGGSKRRLPDLAVRVRFKDSEASVVFLVEFQSSPESSPTSSTRAPGPGPPRPAWST